MIRLKIFTICIALVSVLTAAPGLMGCNQHSSTLESVSVTPANQSMAKETTQQFMAIGTFTNGMSLTWSEVVTWSSSDTTIATVSNTAGSNGIVTSFDKVGQATITAFDAANNISGTATVNVEDPVSITVIPTNPYMAVGTTHQFAAIALFSNGTVTQVITTFAKWEVVSPGVATIADTWGVIGNGIVTTGTVTGTTDIKATDPKSEATGTTTLTVTSTPLESIAISPIAPIISMSTTTLQFTAIGTFQGGLTTEILTPSVTASWNWSSSNTGVVTIDNTGLAQAVAAGTATLTAKDPITGVSGDTTYTLQ